jgi:hypothetical protein
VHVRLSRRGPAVAVLALPIGLTVGALIALLAPVEPSASAPLAARQVLRAPDPTSATTGAPAATVPMTSVPTVSQLPATGSSDSCLGRARHSARSSRSRPTITAPTSPDSGRAADHCSNVRGAGALGSGPTGHGAK